MSKNSYILFLTCLPTGGDTHILGVYNSASLANAEKERAVKDSIDPSKFLYEVIGYPVNPRAKVI